MSMYLPRGKLKVKGLGGICWVGKAPDWRR
jgi:hypothetical protein